MKIRVAQFGLGPIGQACVKVLLQKPGVELVGGIDIDPAKSGRDLGEVCGLKTPLQVVVRSDAATALSEWRAQVVVPLEPPDLVMPRSRAHIPHHRHFFDSRHDVLCGMPFT